MARNKYLSIITLNVNGLYTPIKRHRIVEWIRKHDPHIYFLQETHHSILNCKVENIIFILLNGNSPSQKGMARNIPSNENQRPATKTNFSSKDLN